MEETREPGNRALTWPFLTDDIYLLEFRRRFSEFHGRTGVKKNHECLIMIIDLPDNGHSVAEDNGDGRGPLQAPGLHKDLEDVP